ncbi:hypothetical protein K2F45_15940 [Sphingobacterium siyangense]|uniref:alpha/beta hydrolase-fold protein n=1 Tax=Sphingobacterium siyangense TaxID=459529 RepID=UPI00204A1DAB|nr:alpha/beta hydrolase-fold protein [Sphingobacterium siyangense]UQA73316.1 hypothetical protein K2F45_15940 [Sphingobacterium siyangense]
MATIRMTSSDILTSRTITTIICFFIFSLSNSFAQSHDNFLVIGQRYTINSKILNERRNYSVYLPASYKNNVDKKYIVAYVLDGDRSKFLEVSGIAQSMHSDANLKLQIPELIIVSIENTDRTKEFYSYKFIELFG